MHQNWRDCKAWESEGLKLSSTSNAACKLYDAVLTQFTGWYEEPQVGGLVNSIDKLLQEDPTFVMGKVISYGLDLIGTGRTIRTDLELRSSFQDMLNLAAKSQLTDRERMHVNAIDLWANGHLHKAATAWDSIVGEFPTDMLAIKFVENAYFFMGKFPEVRDVIARTLPQWNPSTPLFSYLHGMFAFGLEETNNYPEAVKHARLGLKMNKNDAWATHALAHVYEMTSGQDKGIKMMTETENDWSACGMLACHNYWHLALYYLAKGNYEASLSIFDSQVRHRSQSGALLDLVDAISLLYRLEFEGVNVGDRWKYLFDICQPHVDDHIVTFNDVHYSIVYQRSGHPEYMDKLLSSMKSFISNCSEYYTAHVAKTVGYSLCQAVSSYDEGKYAEVVDILYPLRYEIIKMGGSHAQRDMFDQLIINSAIKSTESKHHRLAKNLLIERQALKGNSPLTERLMAKALACH